MFTPRERDLERGWPGRLDGDRVIQLAAQTLQAFFTGGGDAREHDVHALADVVLRAPVLHPGAVRMFDGDDFHFTNPSSILGPDEELRLPAGADHVEAHLRLAVVIGAGQIGGFTLLNDWHAPQLPGAKASDFGTSMGPVVVTPDEFDGGEPDWRALLDRAEESTRFFPGDIVAGPVIARSGPHRAGDTVEVELEGVGALRNYVAAPS
jgi:2-keto-4-pentenoate hydratase/2-oxohepta-3-ene-1,7-dioic acid hydratase in catechol pathway